MIDTTIGIENVTWYQSDLSDRRRVQITFQDGLRTEAPGPDVVPAEIEIFGDYSDSSYAKMSVDTPDRLDELAAALLTAAQNWRHCIGECDCQESEDIALLKAIELISYDDLAADTPEGEADSDSAA